MDRHIDRIRERIKNTHNEHQPKECDSMFRHHAEPQPQNEAGLKHQRKGDEQQDVERELGALDEQPVHIGKVALRVTLGELRIEGHLEVGTELLADVLHLHRHGAGGVHRRPEENVEQYVQALRIADDG